MFSTRQTSFPHRFLTAFQSELHPADMVAINSGRIFFFFNWIFTGYDIQLLFSIPHAQIVLALKYSDVSH